MWYTLSKLERNSEQELVGEVMTDADSPWYDGHFPGDPVLPGIGQLDMVAELIRHLSGRELVVNGLSRVKFRRRILPGELLVIAAAAGKAENSYSFRITTGKEQLVSSGIMKFYSNKGSLKNEERE
jgi:3-hydroxymyristoyl/3-hydroxydecanoyl-(acyl carrier protein) dehydratase